jgi:hypothetical protein
MREIKTMTAVDEALANKAPFISEVQHGAWVSPYDPRFYEFTRHYEQTGQRNYDIVPKDVHIDAPLANILLDYRPTGFIADEIFPIVSVGKQSDVIPQVRKRDRIIKPSATMRAPGTLPRYIHFEVQSQTYYANNYALGTYLTAEEIANADAAWNTKQIRGELVMDLLLIDYELRVANLVTSGSNCGSYWTTASAWTDWTNAAPLTDCLGDLWVAEQLSGVRPNKLVMGRYAWENFRNSSEVLGRLFPHGGGGGAGPASLVTKQHAATLLEVDQVVVGGLFYNSAAEGASMTLSMAWKDMVLYYYTPGRPSRDRPAFGYAFRWNVPGMPNLQAQTFPFDPKLGRQDIHCGMYQDEKIVDSTYGVLRTGVGSSQ